MAEKSERRDSAATHGASGKTDCLLFDPEELVLVTDPKHDLYDERVHEEPTEKFVANVLHYGVLTPILVRKNPETGKTEVVFGRKRVKACRAANKIRKKRGEDLYRIKAVVQRSDSKTAIGAMITENEQRVEDTPLNRAAKAARMLERGATEAEVGTAFGISPATVKNLIALIDAPAAVRKAAESGKISTSDAYKLSKLEPEEARKKVAELVEHAPRPEGGKKRSKNAARAREIVDGPKRLKPAAEAASADGDAERKMRAPNQVENLAREIDEGSVFGAEGKLAVRAFAKWILGDDEALKALV
jgi:ParB family chromosome partitioning protein